MVKRTLFFANPCSLSIAMNQLVVRLKQNDEARKVPVEEVGYAIFEHPEISFTQAVMQQFAAHNVAAVFCDSKYMPCYLAFPLEANYVHSERVRQQIDCGEVLKKQLWQQIIRAKIQNQARVLKLIGRPDAALRKFAQDVLSNDSNNLEARAARLYWMELFQAEEFDFARERFGDSPNSLLNYGYAVLRAAMTRALVGSGLLPVVGIHHHNRYNAFCLSDDMMEPFRPFVDKTVWDIVQDTPQHDILSPQLKIRLVNVLTADCKVGKEKSPLMNALTYAAQSLVNCYAGTDKQLTFATLP